MPRSWFVLIALGMAVLLGGVGAGSYAFLHRSTPQRRAEQALAEGRLRDALIELRSASRDDPRSSAAPLLMAQVHARLGDLNAAVRDLKHARALGADKWEVMGQLGTFYLAERGFQDVLNEITPGGPTPAIQARNLAFRSRAHLGLDDLKQAEAVLNQAAAIEPGNAGVQVATARLALARNQVDTADAALDAALASEPGNVEALQVKSRLLASRGALEPALALADRAVTAGPGFVGPQLDRAGLLVALGQDAKAGADVDAVLRLQPRNPAAAYLASVVALHEGRFAEADQRLSGLGGASARFGRAAYFQALAALGQNLPATAVEAASRYVGRAPDDPDGVRLLARAQAANRRPDLAAEGLRAAVARGMGDAQTLDLLGSALAATGDVTAAAEAYRMALAKDPDQPAIRVHLSKLQVGSGDAAEAAAALVEAAKAPSVTSGAAQAGVLQSLATAQVAAGELDAAAATIARLRTATGETEAAGVLDGMLAMARLDLQGAIAAFSATLRTYPDSVTAALDLARALAGAGRRDEARTAIAGVLAKDPRNAAALNSFVQLTVSDQNYPPAIRAVEAARAKAPADDGLLAMLADLLVRQGDPAQAIGRINGARPTETRKPAIWAALARAQAGAGQVRDAEDSFARAFEDGTDVVNALALADMLAQQKESEAARRILDVAIARRSGDFGLLSRRVQLEADAAGVQAGLAKAATFRANPAQMPEAAALAGDLLMRAGNPAEAARAFRAEWESAPTPALALRLAQAQLGAGDDAAATATLASLPGDPSAALLLSQADLRAGRWTDAARNIERALVARPGDPALLNNLAYAYQRGGDPRARATAQRAFRIDPVSDNADTLGWILLGEGAAAEAVPVLRVAVRQRPRDPLLAFHLAAALHATGDADAAIPLLRTALADPGPFDGRDDASSLLGKLTARP